MRCILHNTAGAMKTVPSVYTLFLNFIYLSTVLRYLAVVTVCRKQEKYKIIGYVVLNTVNFIIPYIDQKPRQGRH